MKSREQITKKTAVVASVAALALFGLGCNEQSASADETLTEETVAQTAAGEEESQGWSLLPFGEEEPEVVTIPVGQDVRVRTTSTISTKTTQPGETFVTTLEQPLVVDGKTVAAAGARAVGTVAFVERSGRVKGVARLGVKLTEIQTASGDVIPVSTDSYVVVAKKTHTKDAQKIGIGAGVGAAIGAIAGGGDGALKGAGIGAGGGTGAVLATRGEPAVIGSERVLDFTIQQPVRVEL